MFIHVNFNIPQQKELFNNRILEQGGSKNSSDQYVNKNISEIIYNKETGNIIIQVCNGELQYLDMINNIMIVNIEALSFIDLNKNEIVK